MTTNTQQTFIDLHLLQTVPPSCINRDDTGSPKSALYGGVRRARVSSQAWKKATRQSFSQHLDQSELGERTLRAVERIAARIHDLDGTIETEHAEEIATEVLSATGIKVKVEKKKAGPDEAAVTERSTGYLVFLSRAQIDALARIGVAAAQGEKIDKRAAKQAFKDENSIDVALFGRMIADSPDLNVDAACQVAHAISVHPAAAEFDYFTAVDDNSPEDNAGAGMIGTVEFVSSTLYRYATINAGQLAKNLGSNEAAVRAIEAFVQAFVLSMPTGKQNTFANRTRPGVVLAEIREDQPVNLVGAFENPVRADGGILPLAAGKLVQHALGEDAGFGTSPVSSYVLTADPDAAASVAPILSRAQETDLNAMLQKVSDAVSQRLDQA